MIVIRDARQMLSSEGDDLLIKKELTLTRLLITDI